MHGKLSKIYICREKGATRESVSQASLDENLGLIGDCKSSLGNKNKQLVIMLSEDRENIDRNYSDRGLCTRRFQENILIEGFSLNDLKLSTELKIGESKIEITSVGKKCFKECELVKTKEFCPLKVGVLFAKVNKSGIVNVGDTIKMKKLD